MRILALDVGQHLGWALGRVTGNAGEPPAAVLLSSSSGVHDFAWEGMTHGRRFYLFTEWLVARLEKGTVDVVVYELANQRGGAATRMLLGMRTVIELEAFRAGADCLSVHLTALKKFATDDARAGKDAMVARARKLSGRPITDDNEADAVCLLAYAFSLDGIPRTADG